ncbi:DNA mismatch repair endonuclease MutL [Thalassotalea sp. PLHSN55]|uniref:DNA mismatch repair endonuclease MutL n=1 Tax=Thalassotalea sp. PLHSN55 TaxID=3435888 RepID=UPI003F8299E7
MSIEILPARLANQIAAGEVVERPASVIKELVENSLDAGATHIQIDIEKGGAKRIRIIDNGSGIAKDELTLALSRHATSKIKDLNDLEAISSLGFRGEALASISSVARLTLTSKPAVQENAWQAFAEGRDMQVVVQPAAHPNGTTIDVEDLFFNTPARKKFLRTEKTEFSHIEEVIKRIALARFDVTFVLNHNHKLVRQYRAAKDKSQYSKRIAQICGQRFIDNAIEVDCQHDNLHLSGWLAAASFYRNQNDLCYSYVNGRMMRDKLINHAIRQAYADLLPRDTYPAFVLFLELDFHDVDVNVHPAKHEVRFHQGRYVHDFIFSVCDKALQSSLNIETPAIEGEEQNESSLSSYQQNPAVFAPKPQDSYQQPSYIKPLQSRQNNSGQYAPSSSHYSHKINERAASAYQDLMTPVVDPAAVNGDTATQCVEQKQPLAQQAPDKNQLNAQPLKVTKNFGSFIAPSYMAVPIGDELRLLALAQLEQSCNALFLQQQWQQGLVSQPLLLPIKIKVTNEQLSFFNQQSETLSKCGVVFKVLSSSSIQIRQFPAVLRDKDIHASIIELYHQLSLKDEQVSLTEQDWQQAIAALMTTAQFNQELANKLLLQAQSLFSEQLVEQLLLNSVAIDLTSEIHQLTNL